MKLNSLFNSFELLAESSDSVAKIRSLVLDLATHGKAFSTATHAEWVSVQLGTLMVEGLASVNPAEAPNELFELWSVPAYSRGQPEITAGREIGSTKRELPDRSILLGKINPHLNRVWKVERRTEHALIASPEWITIMPDDSWDADFLALLLASASFNRRFVSTAQGMGSLTRASSRKAAELEIRRPPLAEQKRIVAKVDELLVLCDRLEAQLKQRDEQAGVLSKAAVARFQADPTVRNLECLFHPSFAITGAAVRETVLGLAVRGRLTLSDGKCGDAVAEMIADGIDPTDAVPSVDAQRFPVPPSWCWARFSSVGEQRLGKMLDSARNSGKLRPYLRNTNVQWSRFELEDVKLMRIGDDEVDEYRLRNGDLMICEGGEPGRCAIWRSQAPDMYFQKALHRVRPRPSVRPEYLAICLQHDATTGVLASLFTGATIKHLTGRALAEYAIPIPPLAEQQRIVAKVNELMALVDQLESQITASEEAGTKLLDALVAELAPST